MSPLPIPESFIEELVARSDIEDVVSDYVQLTKRSGANRFGLCPFHSEKTPSFAVNPAKQIFHCFGCGKGGGVINFIMEAENLSYPDAVAFLARRAGMEVPEDGSSKEERSRRARLLELNREAARFFYAQLSQPEGAAAIRYIQKRDIAPQMVKRFGLGAAPDSWSALTDALKRRGYSEVELVEAGLAKRGQKGGVYDTFRNRLMFPVIDVRGSVIGFSGRTLGDGEKEAKYLNSPDTPIFQKSRNLFALNLAKKSKMGILILAEGNIDVVSLHQAGFDCAVASLGTSLTEEQARLMSKYAKEVVIAYDADGAGQKAAQRAIGIFRNTGLNVRILRVEGAKDPDEFLKANGRDAFALLLEKSANDVDYRLEAIARGADLTTEDGRLSYLREATA
ncbi:MAG: DNA primase, partial [bacterium]